MANNTFNILSAVNVNQHTEKKGQFTYVGWTFAWSEVKARFPSASYVVLPENYMRDGSCEVRTEVTIDGQTLPMWLAVTNLQNRAIQNPSCDQVANARMRCLTKNLAMFGLGFYIYAGESVPFEVSDPVPNEDHIQALYEQTVSLLAEGKIWELRKLTADNQSAMESVFNHAPSGKKTKFKEDVRMAFGETNAAIRSGADAFRNLVLGELPADHTAVAETADEMDSLELEFVLGALSEVERQRVETLLKEVYS